MRGLRLLHALRIRRICRGNSLQFVEIHLQPLPERQQIPLDSNDNRDNLVHPPSGSEPFCTVSRKGMSESMEGAREQFIRQPDGLFVATDRLVAAPVQRDNRGAQRSCTTGREPRNGIRRYFSGGSVAKRESRDNEAQV